MSFYEPTFDFASMTKEQLSAVLRKNNIALSIEEALTIQQQMLKRPPTLTECLLWSIQCSEHCSYKSSRVHLKLLPTEGQEVILGPREDAGIVSIAQDKQGRRYGIVISHESHNHPSQIIPFEGAATGVGGNVRDVCCMGAEVIAVLDNLRFGDINLSKTKWIHENVVAGIASYGNALGIPNLGGDVYYDAGYNDNCLVTVVTVGIVREDHIIHSYAPANAVGYDLILVGKATDNSGFAGASFASTELREENEEQNRGAVQEPNAFLGRHLLQSNYALFKILREKKLLDKVGFKDLGAGGVACASVELAESGGYGAQVEVDAIPTSMTNLPPAVILCSETQERYMWVAHPSITPLILEHYNQTFALPRITEKAQAKVVGKITAEKNYVVRYQGKDVINASAHDITKGFHYNRPYTKKQNSLTEPKIELNPAGLNKVLLTCLAHENIASRKPIFENYDKQVQGRVVVEAGTADSGVLQPFNNDEFPEEIREVGLVLGSAQNPRYGKIDAYWGAVNAVAEAVRNVAASGARPIAITDCLCFGNPEKSEQMAEFVDAVKGIADACRALNLPVISGNVSLYNESGNGSVPPSPIISCAGKLTTVKNAVTSSFKKANSQIVLVGERKNECGGSIYYAINKHLGANVPKPDCGKLLQQIAAMHEAANNSLILAAHDISDGGLAVALAEMSFANKIGCNISFGHADLPSETLLFSESSGFVLEVEADKMNALADLFDKHKVSLEAIGNTTEKPLLVMQDCIAISINDALQAWTDGLRNKLN